GWLRNTKSRIVPNEFFSDISIVVRFIILSACQFPLNQVGILKDSAYIYRTQKMPQRSLGVGKKARTPRSSRGNILLDICETKNALTENRKVRCLMIFEFKSFST